MLTPKYAANEAENNPMVIANDCSIPTKPRILLYDSSAIYGLVTDTSIPKAKPVMTLPAIIMPTLTAAARNTTPEILSIPPRYMLLLRPRYSPIYPTQNAKQPADKFKLLVTHP